MSGTKVDPEALRSAIREYEAIRADLEAAHHNGFALSTVQAAGKDAPSQVYANWAQATGKAHQESNARLQETLTARIDNLKATLRQYEQTEQGNLDNLK